MFPLCPSNTKHQNDFLLILPFYLKKKKSELQTCSLIISYICILCMAFLTNFLFFHSIYLFTGFQLLLHTSYDVCVLWGRKLIESWAIIGCKNKRLYKRLCERRIYLINFQSFKLQIFDSLTPKSQSDFNTQFILSLWNFKLKMTQFNLHSSSMNEITKWVVGFKVYTFKKKTFDT
jgi:hypothetical protein